MAKNKHPPTHRAEQAAVTVEETLVTEKKKRRTTHLMNFKQCALPAKFEYNEHRWTNKDWCSVFSHKSCFGFHLLFKWHNEQGLLFAWVKLVLNHRVGINWQLRRLSVLFEFILISVSWRLPWRCSSWLLATARHLVFGNTELVPKTQRQSKTKGFAFLFIEALIFQAVLH